MNETQKRKQPPLNSDGDFVDFSLQFESFKSKISWVDPVQLNESLQMTH